MDIANEIIEVIGKPEGVNLEYKAVLPPSKSIAQLICAFANSEGGYIILGVSDNLDVNGLSQDFHANSITHKALDLLSPSPSVQYQYVNYNSKNIYAIKVDKSNLPIYLEGKLYKRVGEGNLLVNPTELTFSNNGFPRIELLSKKLETQKQNSTDANKRVIDHYQSILKILDDLSLLLYPINAITPTENQEGKILSRILFSSFVDNFETYLSDLLYEIFLANPSTLKSNQQVTIEEVLNCADLQEFVKYWSKQKLSKLQKGSVKGFIKDNKQINDLGILDETNQNEIEKILQIRHLYSHRNGIIDEKFLQYYSGQFLVNTEHKLSINEICDKLEYLSGIINQIDNAAITKYNLSNSN